MILSKLRFLLEEMMMRYADLERSYASVNSYDNEGQGNIKLKQENVRPKEEQARCAC